MTKGAIAQEMAARAGAEFCPIPIRQDDLADHFADAIAQAETLCFNAHGVAKYLLSRAVRDAGYKVVLTGEGSDEILGGYAFFRRDMLLYNREGQDPAVMPACSTSWTRRNPVSRGLLLPDGEPGRSTPSSGVLGFVPSWIETFSARSDEDASAAGRTISSTGIRPAREPFRALFSDIDVRGQLAGRDRCASVALSLGKDRAARLHPDDAGRPDGDGAFDRGARAVSRSSRGRGHPVSTR